jgi:hypothetical protein
MWLSNPEAVVMRGEAGRVLLIAPRFFGYEQEIRKEIERRGSAVDWLPDRPFDSPWMAALTKVAPNLVLPYVDRLYERRLRELNPKKYDTILVINGQTLSYRTLSLLRNSFPTARTILYMWDSMRNRPNVVKNLQKFDATFSFDPNSSRRYGMRLRPLFFSAWIDSGIASNVDYHISFVGTVHSDRYEVIDKLRHNLGSDVSTYWYLYLKAPWVYYAYRLSKPAMRHACRSEFRFVPLEKVALQAVHSRSKAILDIEHPNQTGLTMRTFEAIGSRRKLITTNTRIEEYEFFDRENICVIDRARPRVPAAFLESPFLSISPAVYRRYSIEGWMDDVLGAGTSG